MDSFLSQLSFSHDASASYTVYAVWLGSLSISLYLAYRWALPKPIPGIPYNKEALKTVFGDAPSLVKHTTKTQELYSWMVEQNIKLQSPIIQLFVRPLAKPWVVIADFQEAQDVLIRRTKEFDKSIWFKDVAGAVMPESHIFMRTTPRFKQHRRIIQDIMTPGFLHNVAALHIYNVGQDVIRLWEQKARIAERHPFSVIQDVHYGALDAIWSIIFGEDSSDSTTRAQLELYSTMKSVNLPSNKNSEVNLPRAESSVAVQSVMTHSQSIDASLKSPVPSLAHWAYRQTSAMKKAFKTKEEFIQKEVQRSQQRLEEQAGKSEVRCAVDNILRREAIFAEKEGRKVDFHSRYVYDEVLGLLIAAHDTTSTSILWALKFLADYQEVQTKLREALRTAHMDAVAEKRYPTFQEIVNTTSHYRDAVVEEIFRVSLTEAAVCRTSLVDTEILGHFIPKDTEVFFMCNGPSIFSSPFVIDESTRSPTYIKGNTCNWDPAHMAAFDPDRWLVDRDGQKVFDPSAGPLLIFSLGERGCYGRKMAYLEMRLFLTLLVWAFEFQECPKSLSGYGAIDKLVHAPQQCYIMPVKLTL
ncbi:hypothetical protein VC83_08088 [Pseudogymnoascus destructans]|uniref:Cytochrome P450 monooxygenase n=2 Tax=Pseudogymnoascus destructans TaxID=655981 RepID=L8FUQ8_PSED2|nr:uncharacterized protein VC83_08088 [Pseudogymnoascus destructans]ELR04279.1 hypothetical protein GMDG_06676 [Pseudogymnoascus destructans 20631-21]OAF55985.1 hypothetical protein VC83_08088 [Pseudogymnoascus destructans]